MKDYSAATVEEAIKVAEKELGQSREKLDIKVVQKARHGFLGIGRRPAKISVTVKKVDKKKKSKAQSEAHEQVQQSRSKSEHLNKSSYRNSHEHKQSQNRQKAPKNNKKTDTQISQAEMERRHKVNIKRTKDIANQLADYLQGILSAMDIAGSVVITKVTAHQVDVDIKSDQSGRVIGHHGRRINALEELASSFMDYHGTDNVMVNLDTANYRERRKKALKRVAENAVVDVISTNQAVFLDPMPARERKQIHRQLEHNDHVATYSNGKEPHRSVVIAPKN